MIPKGEKLNAGARQPHKRAFKDEVRIWVKRIGVDPKEVHVRAITRKWGSCSIRGRVTFAKDLLSQHTDYRKRVIVEELLHLKIRNHGKLFRALLKSYLSEI